MNGPAERLLVPDRRGELRAVEPAGATVLLAADSWLVEDGRVRELDGHRRRFAAAVADAGGPGVAEVSPFWEAAIRQLPRSGVWFPRVELVEGARLQLRVRPAPARTDTVRVWLPGRPDPRRVPRRKGPDLDVLTEFRAEAGPLGGNETLLGSADGLVLEAATSSLLWWEEDVLCTVDPELPVLPGVTLDWVLREAAAQGIPVRHRRCGVAELTGREVWLVNALHGIRPVITWLGDGAPTAGPTPRAARWRAAWAAAATPLPPLEPGSI